LFVPIIWNLNLKVNSAKSLFWLELQVCRLGASLYNIPACNCRMWV